MLCSITTEITFFTFLCTFICLLIHDYVLLHHSNEAKTKQKTL